MSSDRPSIRVSVLSEEQVPLYKALRGRALREHPDAFMETPEAFDARSVESLAERLRISQSRGGFTLIALDEAGALIGTASLAVGATPKDAHRGLVWGVYVTSEARGMGVGGLLMRELIGRATQNPTLRSLHLAVVSSNEPALRLYRSLVFTEYGRDIEALCVNGEFLDETLMFYKLR